LRCTISTPGRVGDRSVLVQERAYSMFSHGFRSTKARKITVEGLKALNQFLRGRIYLYRAPMAVQPPQAAQYVWHC